MHSTNSFKQSETIISRIDPNNELFEAIHSIVSENAVSDAYIPLVQGTLDSVTLQTIDKNPSSPENPIELRLKLDDTLKFTGSGSVRNLNGEIEIEIMLSAVRKDGSSISGKLVSASILQSATVVIQKLETT